MDKKLWTVRELIVRLSIFPPDMPVLYNDSEWLDFFSRLNPAIEEVVEADGGIYCEPRDSAYFNGKRQLKAVILNSTVEMMEEKCIWEEEEPGGRWYTACGEHMEFEDTPLESRGTFNKETGFNFCYSCGKPIEGIYAKVEV